MWQKTKMNQNTVGRVVVVKGAQRVPMKDKREGKTQKRKTLQIKKNNQSEKTNFWGKGKKGDRRKTEEERIDRGDLTGKSSEKDFKMNRRQQNKVEVCNRKGFREGRVKGKGEKGGKEEQRGHKKTKKRMNKRTKKEEQIKKTRQTKGWREPHLKPHPS